MEPSQQMRGSFTCSFTTRACSHTPIFASQYKRTNRTKGLKIMRCFPHCCPRHISRSYCGAPLYLQVDWKSASNTDGSDGISPADEQRLKVVARFRTRERGGLSMGQDVPSSIITNTMQETTDSTDGWVSAKLIASANRNSWLFEINKQARWFYAWEVGPTRERRFKPHVFEAYLFYDLEPQQRGAPNYYWRVLAVACSPNFTLVSSRRAGNAQLDGADDELEEALDDGGLYENEIRESTDESLLQRGMEATEASRLPQYPSSQAKLSFDIGLCSDNIVPHTISQQFAVLSWFLEQLPLTSLLQHVGLMEKNFTLALLDELQDVSMAEIIQQKRQRSSSSAVVLSRLLVNAAPATKPLPAAMPLPSYNIAPKSIQHTLDLAMWLFFDKIMGKQMGRFMQQASQTLFNKTELSQASVSWLQWLRLQMDGMLAARASSTEQLIHVLCSHYAANPKTAAKIRWLCASNNQEAVERITRYAFVAHIREVYLSTTGLHPNAHLARHRLQPLPVASLPPSAWSGYTGTWLCMMEDVTLKSSSRTTNLPNFVPGVSMLLWFWRQLSCVSLTIASETNTPALLLSSVFNRSSSDNQLSRLVLDNQPRWFRCLPSGESTNAVPVGGQLFGDYIAWLSTDNHINVQTYSWPSKSLVLASSCAYCWLWQIAQPDQNGLCVGVKVERGRFKRGQFLSMDEDHLSTKLERIDAWEPAYELLLDYTRLY